MHLGKVLAAGSSHKKEAVEMNSLFSLLYNRTIIFYTR